jgi:cephalosporin hydroxylase
MKDTLEYYFHKTPIESTKYLHYLQFYERLFRENRPTVLLEIGVCNGGFLKASKDFLINLGQGPQEIIAIGVDINPRALSQKAYGLEVLIGDITSPRFLNELPSLIFDLTNGLQVDFIIDDGPHFWSSQLDLVTLALRTIAAKKSIIVVEDIHTSYHPGFPGTKGTKPFTEFVKDALDVMQRRSIWCTNSGILPGSETLSRESEIYKLIESKVRSIEVCESIVCFKVDEQYCLTPNVSIRSSNSMAPTVFDLRHESKFI